MVDNKKKKCYKTKETVWIIKELGLNMEAEMNLKLVKLVIRDKSLPLQKETYVNKKSNHSKAVINQIPRGIV